MLRRRTFIAGGGAAAVLLPSSISAMAPHRLQPIIERLRAFARADLAANGLPGMQLAIVVPGNAATFGVGYSEPGTPVSTDQLFQIASITKSLTALAIFRLMAEGRLDISATVQAMLPELSLPSEPITLAQLLEHSSGLPNFLSDSPAFDVPGGRLWTGTRPGSRYSYNNLGYGLLGHVISRVTGLKFDEALTRLVLRPIGMTRAVPTVRIADRARFAVGHSRFRDDVPWLPGARLAPARWTEFQAASGSVAATAADMVNYLRYMIQIGRGLGAPLFANGVAERFRTATIDYDQPGARYGNGLVHLSIEGAPVLRHTGGVAGFTSAFTVDPAAGVGIFAGVNAGGIPYRPLEINDCAIAMLRATVAGLPLPPSRTPAGQRVASPEQRAQFTGRWLSSDGHAFEIAEVGGRLKVTSGGVQADLNITGRSAVTDHAALAPFFMAPFDRDNQVLRLGSRLYGRGQAPDVPTVAPRLAALAGTYYNPQPPSPYRTIHAVGERLFAGQNELRENADRSWRFEDSAQASERLWFDQFALGQPQQLLAGGIRYSRLR